MNNKLGKQLLIIGIGFLFVAEILIGFAFYHMFVSKGNFLEITANLLMGGCVTCSLALASLWVGLKKIFPKHRKVNRGIRILMSSALALIAALYFAALSLFYLYGHNVAYFSGALAKTILLMVAFVALFVWGKNNISSYDER